MLRTICGVFVLGLVIAACGGGNNNTHACGDGHVDADEECDDGNVLSNDGCTSACRLETSHCGDGITEVATEQCDDGNNVSGDGCSANCQRETVPPMNCGNGVIDAGETCDDHNLATGDGCGATCQVEQGYVCTGAPSVCVIPPMATGGTCADPAEVTLTGTTGLTGMATGDTTIGSSMVPTTECLGFSTGDGNDNIWSFTITDHRDVRVELDPSSTFDAAIRVMTTPCDPTTGLVSPDNAFGCADENFDGEAETLAYTNLAPGTYYIVVDSYDPTVSGPYTFTITATPSMCGNGIVDGTEHCDDHNTAAGDGCSPGCYVEAGYVCTAASPSVCSLACGNGTLEGAEECDDHNTTAGDGCDPTCHTEPGFDCGTAEPSVCVPACGNGHLNVGEECDDGNHVAGDRCSATCTLESDLAEVEPNNTTAQVITPVHHQIRGALTAGDADLYKFTLTTAATVEFETYDSIDPDSDYLGFAPNLPEVDCEVISTTLTLFDATGVVTDNTTGLYTDDYDGDFDFDTLATCGYLGPSDFDGNTMQGVLGPGTYTIKVEETNGAAQSRYILDMKITP
jgi:cysteine-rich repeat protein